MMNIPFITFRTLNLKKEYLYKDDKTIIESYYQVFENHMLEFYIFGDQNNLIINQILNLEKQIGFLKNKEIYLQSKFKFDYSKLNPIHIISLFNIFRFQLESYDFISLRNFIIKKINNKTQIIIQFDITCEKTLYDESFELFHVTKQKNLNYLKPNSSTIQIYTEPRIYCGINIAINPWGITNTKRLSKENYQIYKLIDLDIKDLYKDPEFYVKFNGDRKIIKKNIPEISSLPSVYIKTEKPIKIVNYTNNYFTNYKPEIDIDYDINKIHI